MKNLILCLFVFFYFNSSIFSQKDAVEEFDFEPSVANPFGLPNPDAPKEITDYSPMIGICDCKSNSRNPDQTWADTIDMVWKFKYIMNGTAVQDEVWRANQLYAGSIRQFQPDSSEWVVSYFSYPNVPYTPGVWHGNKFDNTIVLTKPQQSPNGMDGFSTLTFYDWNEEGFKWKGEWIEKNKKFTFAFWKIECKKRK